jgi:putative transcriptional regulator
MPPLLSSFTFTPSNALNRECEQLRGARRVPRTKTLRPALALTQEECAVRYRIPLGTLRDWEQGRCDPDQPARAYLAVIAHDPEGVKRALTDKHL